MNYVLFVLIFDRLHAVGFDRYSVTSAPVWHAEHRWISSSVLAWLGLTHCRQCGVLFNIGGAHLVVSVPKRLDVLVAAPASQATPPHVRKPSQQLADEHQNGHNEHHLDGGTAVEGVTHKCRCAVEPTRQGRCSGTVDIRPECVWWRRSHNRQAVRFVGRALRVLGARRTSGAVTVGGAATGEAGKVTGCTVFLRHLRGDRCAVGALRASCVATAFEQRRRL